ncbi:hypothetical protein AA313_de0203698 [Arthrobotrys entomopaga]|nr:hypothetical protein AA313_de0203698 [Arthrobotrys entomopaga]
MGLKSEAHQELRPLAKEARDWTQQEAEERQQALDLAGVAMYGRKTFKEYQGHKGMIENLRNQSLALGVSHDRHVLERFDPNLAKSIPSHWDGTERLFTRDLALEDRRVHEPNYFPKHSDYHNGETKYVASKSRHPVENAPYLLEDDYGAMYSDKRYDEEKIRRELEAQAARDRREQERRDMEYTASGSSQHRR